MSAVMAPATSRDCSRISSDRLADGLGLGLGLGLGSWFLCSFSRTTDAGAEASPRVGDIAASGMTMTRKSAAMPTARQRVMRPRGTPGSRMASRRPSKSERRAIASATFGTVFPTVRTMLSRCSA